MANSNSDSHISLSLRPSSYPRPQETELKHLIARMAAKSNGFRDMTAADLESQITNQMDRDDDNGFESAEDDTKEEKGTPEYVLAQKQKMLQKLTLAITDANLLLNCISLTESSFDPNKAQQTIGPYYKANIPLSSLSCDKWAIVESKPNPDDEIVSKGWKVRALTSSADVLLNAAKRLESEVRQETQYWGQVLSIQKGEWPAYEHPRQRHLLGVRVASTEAGRVFRERGTGIIKTDGDGDFYIDLPKPRTEKCLRVRVSEKGKVVGRSAVRMSTEFTSSLEKQAVLARDSLLDEELLFEMQVEARSLRSLGVMNKDKVVLIPAASQLEQKDNGTFVLIDLVDMDDEASLNQADAHENKLAQSCATSLRLLLFHLHRHRYKRRTTLQPAISEKKRDEHMSSIIKPLMKSMYQGETLRNLEDLFKSVVNVLKEAGIQVEYNLVDNIKEQKNNLQSIPFATQMKRLVLPLDETARPFSATLSLDLPSSSEGLNSEENNKLSIHVVTQFSSSNFGTSYALEMPSRIADIYMTPPEGRIGPVRRAEYLIREEVTKAFCYCLSLDLSRFYLMDGKTGQEKAGWVPVLAKPLLLKTVEKTVDKSKEIHQSRLQVEIQAVPVTNDDGIASAARLKMAYQPAANEKTILTEVWTGQGNGKTLKSALKSWIGSGE